MHTLVCEAEAFPEPQYQWVRVSGTFDENVAEVDNNVLVFTPVRFGDAGEYYCIATSNGHSVESNTSTLTGISFTHNYLLVKMMLSTSSS